jgi:4-amino-4-deoxy-L-arabinose transferase-like glycosyltransferase
MHAPAQDARADPRPPALVALAAALGLILMADSAQRLSATYDEVTYIEVAARWWRTGQQEAITRMGSPLLLWKLQQGPTLALLDALGCGVLIDDPREHLAALLPVLRVGALWTWAAALLITSAWAGAVYGPGARVLAAWVFALSPNLLAHGALLTMELPVTACAAGSLFAFAAYLKIGSRRAWWTSAAIAGLGFACKFSMAVFVPILGLAWLAERLRRAEAPGRALARVATGMLGFAAVMLAVDLVVTGFAVLPASESTGVHPAWVARFGPGLGHALGRLAEAPLPQDWVGFLAQVRHQQSGGPSYLLGARRMDGWWYYYLVALAVKLPLGVFAMLAARVAFRRSIRTPWPQAMLWLVPLAFLVIASLGSKRCYGVRYLLPAAPALIVGISGLAIGPRAARLAAALGLAWMAGALAVSHPHELSYFNAAAGGPERGRLVLADSNLDWGQGALELARLQERRPELRDLTLYYFGQADPALFGVVGRRIGIDAGTVHPGLPPRLTAVTEYFAVSASLQHGPWGPAGYFDESLRLTPVAATRDGTITLFRSADLRALRGRGLARRSGFGE